MRVDGVMLEVDGRNAQKVDVGTRVVTLLGVDIVPIAHGALNEAKKRSSLART